MKYKNSLKFHLSWVLDTCNIVPFLYQYIPKREVIIAPVPDEINCWAGVIPKTFCWDVECKTGTAVVTFNLPSSFLLIKSLPLVITSTTRGVFVELGKITLFVNLLQLCKSAAPTKHSTPQKTWKKSLQQGHLIDVTRAKILPGRLISCFI